MQSPPHTPAGSIARLETRFIIATERTVPYLASKKERALATSALGGEGSECGKGGYCEPLGASAPARMPLSVAPALMFSGLVRTWIRVGRSA